MFTGEADQSGRWLHLVRELPHLGTQQLATLALPADPFAALNEKPASAGHSYLTHLAGLYERLIRMCCLVQLGLRIAGFDIVDVHSNPVRLIDLPLLPNGNRLFIVQKLALSFDTFFGESFTLTAKDSDSVAEVQTALWNACCQGSGGGTRALLGRAGGGADLRMLRRAAGSTGALPGEHGSPGSAVEPLSPKTPQGHVSQLDRRRQRPRAPATPAAADRARC